MPLTIVPTLRGVMPFVTLRVTQRFCDIRWIDVRLRSPLRPCDASLWPHQSNSPRGEKVT
ncbi:hypothetical protein GIW26_07920 [Pseudomonas syringae]|nr:hypothetical protein [Pseudomonas syringae]MCF9004122.1 hypothetical protein [Pseudomonas syringae]